MSNVPSYLSFEPTAQPSHRKERVAHAVKEALVTILQKESVLESAAMMTITKVVVSDDYQWADMWVSVYPFSHTDEVIEELQSQIMFLQKELNKKVPMRHTPKLRFHADTTSHDKEAASKKIAELIEGDESA
ncbi:MAG: ribosome-binding factor A [Parcubacteria group bacterium GW2011_GWA2_47_8]|nr:MAG: ribosome-binding factor A [Parcubacteria group bacterium GW2011_GWA2_47_8]OHB19192.1 MAG: ribosome-binding factor A [Parcubacteria group bacterium RIFCSPHIGHO2_01_FULL_47_10b]